MLRELPGFSIEETASGLRSIGLREALQSLGCPVHNPTKFIEGRIGFLGGALLGFAHLEIQCRAATPGNES